MQSLENFIAYGKRIYASHAGISVYDRAPSQNTTAYGLELAQGWADHLANVLRQSQ